MNVKRLGTTAKQNQNLFYSRQGSVLLLVIGTLSVIILIATLSLSRYKQNGITSRTSGATVESNALFTSIRDGIANPSLCSTAITNAQTLFPYYPQSIPSNVPVTSLIAKNPDGTPMVFASPGMIANGISLGQEGSLVLNPAGSTNFKYYGVQPSPGPSGVSGNYCFQTTLAIVATKGVSRQIASSGATGGSSASSATNTYGGATIEQDFPITILTGTGPQTNKVVGCFGGTADGICVSPATIDVATPPTLTSSCVDSNAVTITWSLSTTSPTPTNESLVCTGPTTVNIAVPPADYETGGITITNGNGANEIPTGSPYICTLTAYNSVNAPGQPKASSQFKSEPACTPKVTITPPNCIDTGVSYDLSWTDTSSTDLGAFVTITSGASTLYSGGNLNENNFVAPAIPTVPSSGTVSFTITDGIDPAENATQTAKVKAAPVAPHLTGPNPASYTLGTSDVPSTISFNWTGVPASTPVTVTSSNGGGSSPTSTTGSTTIAAPTKPGTYNYTAAATGGCANVSGPASNTVTLKVTGPSTAECGSANGASFSAKPSSNLCISPATASAVTATSATSWNWTCTDGTSTVNCAATNSACSSDGTEVCSFSSSSVGGTWTSTGPNGCVSEETGSFNLTMLSSLCCNGFNTLRERNVGRGGSNSLGSATCGPIPVAQGCWEGAPPPPPSGDGDFEIITGACVSGSFCNAFGGRGLGVCFPGTSCETSGTACGEYLDSSGTIGPGWTCQGCCNNYTCAVSGAAPYHCSCN